MQLATDSSTNKSRMTIGQFFLKHNTLIIFFILLIISSIASPSFLTKQNIFNVLRQQAPIVVMALGILLVLLTGGIDLSAGSIAAVGGMLIAMLVNKIGFNVGSLLLSVLIMLALGLLIGLVMGLLITKMKMPAFITTLAFMTIGRGAAYMFTSGQPVRLNKELPGALWLINFGSKTTPSLGIPWAVILYIFIIAIFAIIMKYTSFGRLIIASGSNAEAVRLSGVNVNYYITAAYMICSCVAVLGGVLITARAAIGTPSAADGYEMDAIAGCVIGGTSLSGGKGKVGLTILGVFTLAMIGNIMNLLSIASYPQQVIKGLIIIGAVILQNLSSKKV